MEGVCTGSCQGRESWLAFHLRQFLFRSVLTRVWETFLFLYCNLFLYLSSIFMWEKYEFTCSILFIFGN